MAYEASIEVDAGRSIAGNRLPRTSRSDPSFPSRRERPASRAETRGPHAPLRNGGRPRSPCLRRTRGSVRGLDDEAPIGRSIRERGLLQVLEERGGLIFGRNLESRDAAAASRCSIRWRTRFMPPSRGGRSGRVARRQLALQRSEPRFRLVQLDRLAAFLQDGPRGGDPCRRRSTPIGRDFAERANGVAGLRSAPCPSRPDAVSYTGQHSSPSP